jgi:ACS family hexuronate transporter-like MFS transporter
MNTNPPKASGNFRWVICSLVFFATTINYLDRTVISLLKPTLERELHWSEIDYSNIVTAFQLCYASGLLFAGRFIDRIGTKLGYALSLIVWILSAMAHALAKNTLGFIAARASLGIGESGNFPSAIKVISEWFPQKERALATGIFNSGTALGAIIAPLTVPFIAKSLGWQWAFIATGAIGFLWLICWFWIYELPSRHKRLGKAEFDYIHQGESVENPISDQASDQTRDLSWGRLLKFRQTWAFVLGKFFTDPIWWFYLFWLPAYLKAQFGLEGTGISGLIASVYIISTFGSVFGGWLPLFLIQRGWPVFKARKTSMFCYAICALPALFAQRLGENSPWKVVLIIGMVTAAHQAWSANIFTTVSDMFPKKAVASVTGLGGMAGAFGGMLIAQVVGQLFDHFKKLGNLQHGYSIMFIVCGSAYLVAWLIMHALTPRMKRVSL